jgi:RNA polymerase sporulation-specific sigma factor
MYYNKVDLCGMNTSKLKTLTSEEKHELLRRVKNGDKKAREDLINGNLRLVLSIIQRFAGKTSDADDLFQVGCIGLMKAIDHFDTEIGVKFSTYAVPMIIGEIRRYLRDNNSIRVSRSIRDLAYRALTAREELSKEMAKEPSIDEIYALMKKNGETHTRAEVVSALEAIVEPVSLFDPVYSDGGSSDAIYIMDQISDNENTDEAWLEDIALRDALKKLNERERMIIDKRFFSGKTQMEIADEIGISQAQVSRLEKGAIDKLRRYMQ